MLPRSPSDTARPNLSARVARSPIPIASRPLPRRAPTWPAKTALHWLLAGVTARRSRAPRPEIAGKSEHNTRRSVASQAAHCELLRVPYSVLFADYVDLPADLRRRALETLVDIAETLESIPSSS